MNTLDQIAAQLQGYDPRALPADTVNAFLAHLVEPVADTEKLPVMQALGRVLAQDLISPLSVPPHDNSAMDGYAFDGAALRPGQALTLRCVGGALAGAPYHGAVAAGECVKITTGAPMPAGLDTVLPQEFASVRGDAIDIPAGAVRAGDNRRLAGEDVRAGSAAPSKA